MGNGMSETSGEQSTQKGISCSFTTQHPGKTLAPEASTYTKLSVIASKPISETRDDVMAFHLRKRFEAAYQESLSGRLSPGLRNLHPRSYTLLSNRSGS